MTNINKIVSGYNMHSHKATKCMELLNNHLPHGYSKKVKAIADARNIKTSPQIIRNVKSLVSFDLQIFTILIEFAALNEENKKKSQSKLDEILN